MQNLPNLIMTMNVLQAFKKKQLSRLDFQSVSAYGSFQGPTTSTEGLIHEYEGNNGAVSSSMESTIFS